MKEQDDDSLIGTKIDGREVRAMKMDLERTKTGGIDGSGLTGTAEVRRQNEHPRSFATRSNGRPRRSPEVTMMRDLQSYGLMEEKYGIQDEGIF